MNSYELLLDIAVIYCMTVIPYTVCAICDKIEDYKRKERKNGKRHHRINSQYY